MNVLKSRNSVPKKYQQESEKHGIQEMRSNRKAKGKLGMMGRKCTKMTVICQGGLEKNHPGASREYGRPEESCVQWRKIYDRLPDEFDHTGRGILVHWQV